MALAAVVVLVMMKSAFALARCPTVHDHLGITCGQLRDMLDHASLLKQSCQNLSCTSNLLQQCSLTEQGQGH